MNFDDLAHAFRDFVEDMAPEGLDQWLAAQGMPSDAETAILANIMGVACSRLRAKGASAAAVSVAMFTMMTAIDPALGR